MKKIIDSHIHTHYCHGTAEVFEMIECAISKGLTGIGFSEHFHYDFFDDLGLPTVAGRVVDGTPLDQFKLYYKSVQRAKEFYQDKIDIRLGVEVDYLEEKKEEIKQSLDIKPFKDDYKEENPDQKFEFDFIMGSAHFMGSPLKYLSDYQGGDDNKTLDIYFDFIKNCVKSELFDILAHPEIIKYFVDKKEEDYKSHLEELTDLLAENKMAVDVNTDYLKDPKTGLISEKRINPGIVMLEMCRDKKIPLILGSDAHKPEKIMYGFKEIYEMLKRLDITELYYIEQKKFIGYEI